MITRPQWDSDTVLAVAAAADPSVTDRIAKLHPALARLATPGIGRVLARLMTLGDVARISGLPLETLMQAVNDHAQTKDSAAPSLPPISQEARPEWFPTDENTVPAFDVRPIIAQGGDPFNDVMTLASKMQTGDMLRMDAPFNPAPLRRIMGGRGFSSYAQRLAPDHFHIWFCKNNRADGSDSVLEDDPTCPATARTWEEDGKRHVDTRGLQPPGPLLAVIRFLDETPRTERIILHHDREPVYLFPELAQRGWNWRELPAPEGMVYLEIFTEDN